MARPAIVLPDHVDAVIEIARRHTARTVAVETREQIVIGLCPPGFYLSPPPTSQASSDSRSVSMSGSRSQTLERTFTIFDLKFSSATMHNPCPARLSTTSRRPDNLHSKINLVLDRTPTSMFSQYFPPFAVNTISASKSFSMTDGALSHAETNRTRGSNVSMSKGFARNTRTILISSSFQLVRCCRRQRKGHQS